MSSSDRHHTLLMRPIGALLYLLLFILALQSLSLQHVYANGLFELTTGLTKPTGSEMESKLSFGNQFTLGWGTRPSFMGEGNALYLYGALRRESLSQEGPIYYGTPEISRIQWTPSMGLRAYHLLNRVWRFSFDLGLGYTFDKSYVSTAISQGLIDDLSFSGESSTLILGLGLQYKISAGLLLSLGYEQLIYLSSRSLSSPEHAFLSAQGSTLTGRGRLGLGIGFYL